MRNYFEIHYNKIKYPIDSGKSRGLRNAQLGAIHAVSSFFTLNEKDAAIVIMPTGSGKTPERQCSGAVFTPAAGRGGLSSPADSAR